MSNDIKIVHPSEPDIKRCLLVQNPAELLFGADERRVGVAGGIDASLLPSSEWQWPSPLL